MALHQFDSPDSAVAARATGNGRFETAIRVRGAPILADEPVEVGGGGLGPTPYELLSAALAACTSMTLRLYAERKGWAMPGFTVEVAHSLVPAGADGGPPRDRFDRVIAFDTPLDPAQQARMLEIADKCPVHRTLMRGFEVSTRLGPPDEHPSGEAPAEHERQMEQACAE
jgi:putative redox protein